MSFKKITHKEQMAEKIEQGITEIASIVKRTLGPGGLPILIERQGVSATGEPLGPMITKDGVTVASECSNPDPEIDLVIQSVKAICKKTNRVAGDGTTTAIVLGEAILKESIELLRQLPSLNPQLLRESVEAAALETSKLLKEDVKKVSTPEEIEAVALISANGDREVAQTIRQAFEAVGAEGVITVDEGHSAHTTVQVVNGFQVRRGAEAQDRFFNNSERTRYEAENVHVVLFDGQLMAYTDLIPILNNIAQAQIQKKQKGLPALLIMANDFSQEVIQFLLIQKAEMGLQVCAVKSPHTTSVRTQMLDDIAILLGGTRLGNGNANLQSGTFEDVGVAARVVVDKYTTTFYDGAGSEEEILERVDQLKAQRRDAESPYDAALISDRIAALSGGVAKIGVGGQTDLEIKERYHRIEDALNAARAAVEEGVIPGGGISLAKIAYLFQQKPEPTWGEAILSKALKSPFLQIAENVGEDGNARMQEVFVRSKGETPLVYDAREKRIVDAYEVGIIDPFKVTRTALENAVSISALLSTCGGGITLLRK